MEEVYSVVTCCVNKQNLGECAMTISSLINEVGNIVLPSLML